MNLEKMKKMWLVKAVVGAVLVVILLIVVIIFIVGGGKKKDFSADELMEKFGENGYVVSDSDEKVTVILLTYPEERRVASVSLINVSSGEDVGDLLSGGVDFYLITGTETGTYRFEVVLDNGDTADRVIAIGDEKLYYIEMPVGETSGEDETDDLSRTENYVYYEAEAEENIFGGETICTAASDCSGGKKVGYIGNDESSTLTFNGIETVEEGNYEVALVYCSGEERTVNYSVNGGVPVSIDTPSTGGFDRTGVVTFVIKLEEGTNTIEFGNATSYAPDIDRIGIRLLSEGDGNT